MAAGRIAAALLLVVAMATHAASARMLLHDSDDSCEPVAGSTGDPTSPVPKGFFSVIMAPYNKGADQTGPTTFIYGSEHELVIEPLEEVQPYYTGQAGPGDVVCWLKDKSISILANPTFLNGNDYNGTITRNGETIQIDKDSRCTIGLRKKYTPYPSAHPADTVRAVRCLLAV